MNDTRDYRTLLQTARDLSRLPIDSIDARDAVARARIVLPRGHRYARVLAWCGGIAAVLALATSLFITFAPQRASAAERLAEAAGATRAYRGWVHLTVTPTSAKSPMAAMVKLD